MVNLVVRTALLDQLQGFGLMESLQLIQLGSSDNQIDHSQVLDFIYMTVLYNSALSF